MLFNICMWVSGVVVCLVSSGYFYPKNSMSQLLDRNELGIGDKQEIKTGQGSFFNLKRSLLIMPVKVIGHFCCDHNYHIRISLVFSNYYWLLIVLIDNIRCIRFHQPLVQKFRTFWSRSHKMLINWPVKSKTLKFKAWYYIIRWINWFYHGI